MRRHFSSFEKPRFIPKRICRKNIQKSVFKLQNCGRIKAALQKSVIDLDKCEGAIMFGSVFGLRSSVFGLRSSVFGLRSSVFGLKSSSVKLDVGSSFSRSAKAAVSGLAALALLLSSAPIAKAGQWQASFVIKKDCVLSSVAAPKTDSTSLSTAYANIHPTDGIKWGMPWSGGTNPTNTSASVSSQVKIKVLLRWLPSGGLGTTGDPAPPTVTVKVVPSVESFLGWNSTTGSFGSISSSNGYGDASNTPLPGTPPPATTPGAPMRNDYTIGAHLLTLPVSGGIATVPEKTLSGAFSAYNGGGNVSTWFTVYLNNRSVKISRVGAPFPKQVGGSPYIILNKQTDEWEELDTNGQWVGYGHSRYSYEDYRAEVPDLKENWQNFNANYLGAWSSSPNSVPASQGGEPKSLWWWNPSGDGNTFGPLGNRADTWKFMTKKMDFGSPYTEGGAWKGGSTSSRPPLEFSYTAQDRADNAKATAKYKLQLHDEWENLRRGVLSKDQDVDKDFPSGPSAGNFWVARNNGDKYSMSGQVSTTIVAGEEIQYGFSAGFEWDCGFNLGFNGSKTFTESREFSLGSSVDVPEGSKRYPYVHMHYFKKHYLVDKFSNQGHHKNTARTDGSWEQWIGDSASVELHNTWSLPIPIDDYGYSQ